MLTIRFQRTGKKNKVDYRIVLAESTSHASKKFVEIIGSYNPHTKNLQLRSEDRLKYWVNEQHVKMSPSVHNLFVTKGMFTVPKQKAFTVPKKEEKTEAVA